VCHKGFVIGVFFYDKNFSFFFINKKIIRERFPIKITSADMNTNSQRW